jgi:hypothetical protein
MLSLPAANLLTMVTGIPGRIARRRQPVGGHHRLQIHLALLAPFQTGTETPTRSPRYLGTAFLWVVVRGDQPGSLLARQIAAVS